MSTEEIKQLVASKIAGQGSAVDVGGALPTILNAIVDSIPLPFDVDLQGGDYIELTAEQAAAAIAATAISFEGEVYPRNDSMMISQNLAQSITGCIDSNLGAATYIIEALFGRLSWNAQGDEDDMHGIAIIKADGKFYALEISHPY